MSRKLTQRGRERRLQILREAAALFSEQGYHPTSVAEIWIVGTELMAVVAHGQGLFLRARQCREMGKVLHPLALAECAESDGFGGALIAKTQDGFWKRRWADCVGVFTITIEIIVGESWTVW